LKPHIILRLVEQDQTPATRRDFKREPWMVGEGPRYFTPERIADMAAENEARRRARKARK
jgi:hypothetical protein